jgi:hypothetical protein
MERFLRPVGYVTKKSTRKSLRAYPIRKRRAYATIFFQKISPKMMGRRDFMFIVFE